MENTSTITTLMPYIRYVCWGIIIGCGIYLIYRRSINKIVTLSQVRDLADKLRTTGADMFVSKLSVMPDETKKAVRKQLGIQTIINGYKDDGSVFVTVTDIEGKIVYTDYLMGTSLNEELELAMGEKGLNIKLQ